MICDSKESFSIICSYELLETMWEPEPLPVDLSSVNNKNEPKKLRESISKLKSQACNVSSFVSEELFKLEAYLNDEINK